MNKFTRISQINPNAPHYLDGTDRDEILKYAIMDTESFLRALKDDMGFFDLTEKYESLGRTISALLRAHYKDIYQSDQPEQTK